MSSVCLRLVSALLICLPVFSYLIGTGIGDITGPSVEINFMGYALPNQRGSGIHLRLRARAYVFADDNKRFAFISVDGGMGSDLVNMRVIDKLNEKYGGLYTQENICISGTHTHSGPAGFLQYVLYQVTSLGFVQETFDAWVNGIVEAIDMAHANLKSGYVFPTQGELEDSNINRSPTSYLLNPEEEQAQYDADTDKNMFLLSLISDNEEKTPLGVINWFAVHATSMNNTNTLVSGDNKGYASYAMEKEINGPGSIPGKGPFIAAFASTNLGDVSPNTNGAKCIDTGLPCEGTTSSCNGKCENCIAFGPGTNGDIFESTQIIGDHQFQHALMLMKSFGVDSKMVSGPIDFRQSYVTFPGLEVNITALRERKVHGYSGSTSVKLCSPAMGYSFAAGTTDGPGMFNFTQGTTTGNPFWNKVRDFLSEPTKEEMACQHPKPILLNTGDIDVPYEWDPTTISLQILRLGNVFILSVPSEFTTMAGRRLRGLVTSLIRESGVFPADQEIFVTISGLANGYSSYVTTYEEYQAQRYEAASTIYGPHTLDGYLQEFSRLTTDLLSGMPSATSAPPADLTDVQLELMPGVRFDRGFEKGIVEGKDAKATYLPGEIAEVTFHAANPRNNQRAGGSFLTVDLSDSSTGSSRWTTVAVDGDWSTKFRWIAGPDDTYAFGFSHVSQATVSWEIPSDVKDGKYRICYYGDAKVPLPGVEYADLTAVSDYKIRSFSACSSEFSVLKQKRFMGSSK